MKVVQIERPTDWDVVNVYTLADLHIGDPNCDMDAVKSHIKQIADDPHGVCVLAGDLCNNAVKGSPSLTYGEVSPIKQMMMVSDMLMPIADKVICACNGNHENRTMKDSGIDITRLICRELGVEDKYAPEGLCVFIRFGQIASKHGYHKGRDNRQFYSIYCTHGSRGGRTSGSKINGLESLADIVDCDLYIMGHTHLPAAFKNDFYRTNVGGGAVTKVTHTYINVGAQLDYGGYGQSAGYRPSNKSVPIAHLHGSHKEITVTI